MNLPQKSTFRIFVAGFFCLFSSLSGSLLPAQEIPEANKHVIHGSYALAHKGNIQYSLNATTRFIPASTIKLVTTLAALRLLGPDYSFTTELYLDDRQNLFIKGYGDPFLVSEKVARIASLVSEKGIGKIGDIILDDSAFALQSPPPGSRNSKNPYDVNCAALAVNFNTIPLQVYHQAKITSPEPQTPYLPIMGRIGAMLSSGYHRVNIDAFPPNGTISNALHYCGELFQTLLAKQGISTTGNIRQGKVPPEAQLLLSYSAEESLAELVQSCLLSSNNFMANQLYLTLGVTRYGYPATWEKSRRVMHDFITDYLKLSPQQLTMVEGSGIAPENRATAEALIVVLEHYRPYAPLIPVKYGTRMKSGTLKDTGVFCYAGYIPSKGNNRSFVILLNQQTNRRDAILKALYSH